MYADDIVISDNVQGIQEDLEKLKESLEQNGLHISFIMTRTIWV